MINILGRSVVDVDFEEGLEDTERPEGDGGW